MIQLLRSIHTYHAAIAVHWYCIVILDPAQKLQCNDMTVATSMSHESSVHVKRGVNPEFLKFSDRCNFIYFIYFVIFTQSSPISNAGLTRGSASLKDNTSYDKSTIN